MLLKIEGKAMDPTLMDQASVMGTRRFESVTRGDIVGFRYPRDESKSFVKRVVGMPGERIASVEGRISINGQPLDEPYVVAGHESSDTWGPISIPDGEYFMLGDNRRNSSDSRHWGTVRREAVWAKLFD